MATYSDSSAGQRVQGFSILGRRRRVLVPGGYQVRSILLIGLLTLILVCSLNVVLYLLLRADTLEMTAIAPELHALVSGQNRDLMGLILAASASAFLGVLAIALFETHKTAGPILNLLRTMERLAEHGPTVRLKLRKDDHFREIETQFNRMAEVLEARSRRQCQEIGACVEAMREIAESLTRPGGYDAEAAAGLRTIALQLQRVGEGLEGPGRLPT